MGNIYKITNTVNGKVYIGKTVIGVENRWRKHQTEAQREDRGYKSALYDALNKYGVDKFTIETIETCPNDALDIRERFWIKYFNSYVYGYNLTVGGDGHNIVNEQERAEVLSLWQQGVTEQWLSDATGRSVKTIRHILRSNGVTREEILAHQKAISRPQRGKPIYVYDLNGNYLMGFGSVIEASETLGIHHTTLGHVISGRHKSVHGLMMRTYKADSIKPYTPSVNAPRKIYCLETDTIYRSMTDAQKDTGVDRHIIKQYIEGKRNDDKFHFSLVCNNE